MPKRISMFLRRKFHDWQSGRSRVREARTRIAELVGSQGVLEIGCGFGPNADYCLGPYVGIDIDPEAIQEAQRRHPTKRFLCARFDSHIKELKGLETILLCAVLHEMPDRNDVLHRLMKSEIRRIVICDYNPNLRGWLRWWMAVLEPEAKHWWHCDPVAVFPASEWSIEGGQLTPSLLWWIIQRR